MQLAAVYKYPAGLTAVEVVAAGIESDTAFQGYGDLQASVPVKRGIDVVSIQIVPVYFYGKQ